MARYLLDRWRDVAFIHLEPYRYSVVADTPVLEGTPGGIRRSPSPPTRGGRRRALGRRARCRGSSSSTARDRPRKVPGRHGQRRRRRHPRPDRTGRLTARRRARPGRPSARPKRAEVTPGARRHRYHRPMEHCRRIPCHLPILDDPPCHAPPVPAQRGARPVAASLPPPDWPPAHPADRRRLDLRARHRRPSAPRAPHRGRRAPPAPPPARRQPRHGAERRRRPPRRPPRPGTDPGRLDRPRCRGPRQGPPLHRRSRPGAQGHLPAPVVRQARRDPRRRGRLSGARPEAGLRPGPAARPQRRADAAEADARGRRQGLQPDDRRDRAEDRRAAAAGRRASATTASGPVRRSGSTRATRSGRSSPTTSRRRPASTSTASSSTTSSRTASRS